MTRHSGLSLIGLLGAVGQIRRHFVIAMALVAFSGCSQNMAIKEVVSGKAKALNSRYARIAAWPRTACSA
jgi:hypothetical protein